MLRVMIVVLFGMLSACNKNASEGPYPGCGHSVGTCHEQSTACGISIACPSRTLGLKCTPPAVGEKTIQCTCTENAVLGKKVELAFGTPNDPFTGNFKAIVQSACAYPE